MAKKPDRLRSLYAALSLTALVGGCGWRELQHDELFGADAGMPDADAGADLDQGPDVVAADGPDAQTDLTTADTPPAVDIPPAVDAEAPCTPTSCAAEQFCDDLTQRCQPKQGLGMLSGVVYSSCDHRFVPARIGIAGQHQCAVDLKGSYYFRSDLPVGMLTLSAYSAGYKVFSIAVDVKATGTIQDIALLPDTPNGCSDPAPPPVACTCTISGCPGVP